MSEEHEVAFPRPLSGNTVAQLPSGLAPLFAKGTPVIEHVDADLTIRGLLEVHRRNVRA